MGRQVVIVDGVRTPFVKSGAELREVPAWELGRAAARELLARLSFPAHEIDEVVFGCVAQPSDTANIARTIALRAGVPEETPAMTVGRNCASGLEAVTLAAERILAGRADTVLAGGVESMSSIALEYPLSLSGKLAGLMRARSLLEKVSVVSTIRWRDVKPVVALERGLTDPTCGEIMGATAERLAREFCLGRDVQDEYALRSHRRAVAAAPLLREEIAPFAVPPRLAERIDGDRGPRAQQSLESLAKMKPYFDRQLGSVTIGNSCQITDGAVALLLMEEKCARSHGLRPIGRLLSHAYRGCDPRRMGLGPVHAAPVALKAAGVNPRDVLRVELNEAFAAQVLACVAAFADPGYSAAVGLKKPWEIDPDRLNVNGGAIALGHPVGATGARLLLTLCRELRRQGGGVGLATLCVGGGQGGAVVVEGMAA
ncbi:MAG: thiolase family protein [Planctomycetota bacterium]